MLTSASMMHPSADDLSSLAWLLQRNCSPVAGGSCQVKSLPGTAEEKGRRARRHLGRARASPYAAQPSKRSRCAGPVYWSAEGETGVTDEGEELEASRPPFSFTCLIGLAILKSGRSHISVGDIYKYMTRNFPFFKTAKPTWRNSVRHVLSLGKYFCKRRPGSAAHDELGPCVGKGAVWSIKGAMLPSLLQHIQLGTRQLQPATARHLGLDRLAAAVAATAAINSPALPSLPALPTPSGLLLQLDQLPSLDELAPIDLGVGEVPASPTGTHYSCSELSEASSSWGSSHCGSSDSGDAAEIDFDLELGLGFGAGAGADSGCAVVPDWLDRSMDQALVSSLSALLDGALQPAPFATGIQLPEPELPSIGAWFDGCAAQTPMVTL